jgi:AraC-like DNA-binding protein
VHAAPQGVSGLDGASAAQQGARMTDDGLSAVLNSIKVSETGLVAMDLYAPWSIAIDYDKPITVTVIEGRLWLKMADNPPESFNVGESFVLPRGISRRRYVVSSDASLPNHTTTRRLGEMGRFEPVLPDRPDVSLRRLVWGQEGGARTRLMSFTFDWQDPRLGPLIAAIPQIIRVRHGSQEGFLRDPFLGLDFETQDAGRPGFQALMAQLAQLFLIQTIRSHALSDTAGQGGLLVALADPPLSRALGAMHANPGEPWSVERLADCAGLSRSGFARRFHQITGMTPMGYLRSWRLHLARRALRDGNTTVSSIAYQLGYQSEAAFRTSFRKETGQSPREYAKSVSSTDFDSSFIETDQSF